jgi:hypothetical protein
MRSHERTVPFIRRNRASAVPSRTSSQDRARSTARGLQSERTQRERLTMKRSLTATIVVFLVLASAESRAHHSMAAYNREAPVTIEGVIVRREWINPHVYLYVEQDTGAERIVWEVEGWPPFVLKRLGWTEETVNVGDRVTITGLAGRNPEKKIVLMHTLTKPGEAELDTRMAKIMTAFTQPGAPVAQRAEGLAGRWVAVFGPDALKLMFPTPSIQLAAKGQAAAAAFDEKVDTVRCDPTPSPVFMVTPDVKSIEVRRNRVLIRGGEAASGDRIVHLDVESHDGAAESAHGHSIGRWEGRTLVIDTARFAPYGPGGTIVRVASGSAKHLVERLELHDDGSSLTYSYELEDPEYLAAPVTGTIQWQYRPDLEYHPVPCDLDNARRFVE